MELEQNDNDLALYPNPAQDRLRFRLEDNSRGSIVLHLRNAIGQVLVEAGYHKSGKMLERPIDLHGIPAGLYFLELESELGRKVAKLLIER